MGKRDVVVVGASAGGVEALREVVSQLPSGFPAAILVVLHVPASGRSALPQILERVGSLPAKHAEEGDRLLPGRILVAPPDRHLMVRDGSVHLSHGPRENGHRPAVDVLFRSAAVALGGRVVAVVLSGTLDDGAAGMVAVKQRGGVGIVQASDDALYAGMPSAASAAAAVDRVLPARTIAGALVEVVADDADDDDRVTPLMQMENAVAEMDDEALSSPERPGEPSGWSCPDCHGSLFEIHEGALVRYRCRVGHAWSPDSLVEHQGEALETALWVAMRTLEEKASLTLELSRRAAERGHQLSGEQFERQSEDARRAALVLRDLIDRVTEQNAATQRLEA